MTQGIGPMPRRLLGSTGPELTRIGLGTWAIGGPWRFGWGPVDDEESIAAIRHAVDAGVNWVDTAPIYGLGHAEEVVGRALEGYSVGEDVFVATKCGRRSELDGSIVSDLRPDAIRSECELSLRRLGVERLDLLQIHWPDLDSGTPLEDSWATLSGLVDEGKVRWLGVSNFDVDQLDRCERIRHVDSLQPPLSILRQGALRTTIRWAVEHGAGVVAYSPMASGLLPEHSIAVGWRACRRTTCGSARASSVSPSSHETSPWSRGSEWLRETSASASQISLSPGFLRRRASPPRSSGRDVRSRSKGGSGQPA